MSEHKTSQLVTYQRHEISRTQHTTRELPAEETLRVGASLNSISTKKESLGCPVMQG